MSPLQDIETPLGRVGNDWVCIHYFCKWLILQPLDRKNQAGTGMG